MSLKVKVFTLRVDAETGQYDDSSLTEFLETHEAASFAQHMVMHDGEPVLVMVVTWRQPTRDSPAARGARPTRDGQDPRAGLPADVQAAYDVLRTWRNQRTKATGKPAYSMFANAEMAEIARRRPTTRSALAEIPGLGEGRIKDFGDELVGLLAGLPPAATAVEATPDASAAQAPSP